MIPGAPLFMPAIRKKPTPGGGYSFTMTAGTDGFGSNGYNIGLQGSSYGSIDHEPIPGVTLAAFYTQYIGSSTLLIIYIMGDALELVEGLDVWVDGVPLDVSEGWKVEGDITYIQTVAAFPAFIPDEEYFIEIK